MQNVSPKPIRTLADMNIATLVAENCNATPASMMTEPENKAARLPKISDIKGVNGSP